MASATGFISRDKVEWGFRYLLLLPVILSLLALSYLGTFYALLGDSVPLGRLNIVAYDMWQYSNLAMAAGVIQAALTIGQYGSRILIPRDKKWLVGYLLFLGVSVYYNIQGYLAPLTVSWPWYIAIPIIIICDILPEMLAVKE